MIYVLHENDAWLGPLRAALDRLALAYDEWYLDRGLVPLDEPPPGGVFYNRMSASSHTRDHRFAPELTHLVLNWLELHGRRVINGSRALYLEISKLAQYAALERAGIPTPRTVATVGRDEALHAARRLGAGPYILKPNRGGKGLGVVLVDSVDDLAARLDDPATPEPVDGIHLVQEYVRPRRPFIVRCEFVGGRFLYAVRVDTSEGFELCPADACRVAAVDDLTHRPGLFEIITDFDRHPIIAEYENFLRENDIQIAGIEFIQNSAGDLITYDVNTNTNYNAEAERTAGLTDSGGMHSIARFLGDELAARGLSDAVSAAS